MLRCSPLQLAGVRLRNNKEAGPPPDEEDDLQLPFFETQLCAAYVRLQPSCTAQPPAAWPCLSLHVLLQATPGDGTLQEWFKQEGVMIETIPPEVRARGTMSGWRDPIIFETPETSDSGCVV